MSLTKKIMTALLFVFVAWLMWYNFSSYAKVSDAETKCDDGIEIFTEARDIIRSSLTHPATAEFAGMLNSVLKEERTSGNTCMYGVKSYVDSQNSFGATVRTEYLYVVEVSDSGEKKVVNLEANGEAL